MTNLAEQETAGGEILKDPDAARYVGMSKSWLRQTRMMGRSDGPPWIRVGTRAIRYSRRDLDRWLEQRSCGTAGNSAHHVANAPTIPPHQGRERPQLKRRARRQRR
jgi:predicted DNA-binding transcriptional regulator AlpA